MTGLDTVNSFNGVNMWEGAGYQKTDLWMEQEQNPGASPVGKQQWLEPGMSGDEGEDGEWSGNLPFTEKEEK
jgi:hypothetical protein